jgi:hypothetical protein
MEIMDDSHDASILVAVEFTKAEHMVVHERARELDDESQSECDGGESCFIRSVKLWERSAYLTRFG